MLFVHTYQTVLCEEDCSVYITANQVESYQNRVVSLSKRLENGYFSRAISTENRMFYNIRKFQTHTVWENFERIRAKRLSNCHKVSYNIAFVNSERWLAKSRVDITLCQHGKFPATLLFKFFVLYYKRNIKHFFRIDIQLYQHSWKLEKLEIVWKHSALLASCFHTISRFSNFHSCWYNCISTRKMFYIS